jgi:hypothetical protein
MTFRGQEMDVSAVKLPVMETWVGATKMLPTAGVWLPVATAEYIGLLDGADIKPDVHCWFGERYSEVRLFESVNVLFKDFDIKATCTSSTNMYARYHRERLSLVSKDSHREDTQCVLS